MVALDFAVNRLADVVQQSGAFCGDGIEPEKVDEAATVVLAHDIAQRIENELQYPGQVKVVVIRESRAIGIAK